MTRSRAASCAALLVLSLAAPTGAQIAPAPGEGNFNAGLSHLSGGRVEMAIEEFKQAVKGDPKNPYFRKALGLAYARRRQYAEATAELKKALELSPYYVDVRNDLGTILIVSGKTQEGRTELLKVFTDPMNPTPEMTARNIAQSYYDEKDYTNALTWFRTSVERNNAYPDGQLGLAEALLALNRPAESVAVLEGALMPTGENAEILLVLGQAYQKQGNNDRAREVFEKAQKQDPGGPLGQRASELLKTLPLR